MKKCIIISNLIFYITFLNKWNFIESHPTHDPAESSTNPTSSDTKESTPTITSVTLDINNTKDTNEFNYNKNGDFRTYTPKSNYVFNKVVKTYKSNSCVSTCCGRTCCGSIYEHDIWTAKPNDHGLKVVLKGSGKDEKHMAILLKSGNFVLLRKNGKNQPWKDLTNTRHDITKLKFLDENDSELSNSDYSVTLVDLSYTYEFNTGVKCKKIKYGDEEVWKHTDDNNFADIKSFSLHLLMNKFILKNLKDETKELSKPAVIHVALDINKNKSTNEFEYTKEDDVITYKVKSDHVFNRVTQGTTDIWESKDVCGTLVRTMTKTIKVNKKVKYLAILLSNDMFKFFIQFSGKWQDFTSKRYDITKLKFLGESDTELKSSDYTVTLVDLSYTYMFNDGIKCKKIKYGDDDVWKHDDDSNFSEIKSFSLHLLMNKFILKNQSDQTKELNFKPTPTKISLDLENTQSTNEFDYTEKNGVITYKPKDNNLFNKVSKGTKVVWESKDDVCGTLVRTKTSDNVKYLAILLTNNTFSLFNEESGEWQDITKDRYDITKLKFLGENDAELSNSDYKIDLIDLSFTYIFNDGVKCKKIKYGDDEVWKHDDDTDYSEITAFSLGLISNSFYVINQNESKKLDFKASIQTPATTGTPN